MREQAFAATQCAVFCLLTAAPICAAQVANSSHPRPRKTSVHPGARVLYTGDIDGFLGSWKSCAENPSKPCKANYNYVNSISKVAHLKELNPGAILVGMGDNLGPDWSLLNPPPSSPPSRLSPLLTQRGNILVPLSNNAIHFLSNYDAVVPGKQDFVFGVEFLRALGDAKRSGGSLPLIANNLTVQFKAPPPSISYPTPTPASPALPNQVANALSASSSAAAGAGSPAGGAGGKGKGKGGGGGGGGGATGAAATTSTAGGSTGTPAAGNSGQQVSLAGCGSGAAGNGTVGNTLDESQPQVRWPDSCAIYPWTTELVVSIPNNYMTINNTALVCSASNRCKIWGPPTDAAEFGTSSAYQRYEVDTADIPVERNGEFKSPGQDIDSGALFPGTSVKVCVDLKLQTPTPGSNSEAVNRCTPPTTVQSPIFQHAWLSHPNIPAKTTLAQGGPITAVYHYAIFGVLASDTLNGLSEVNQEWYSSDPFTIPQIAVRDAGSALSQAIRAYNLLNSDTPALGIVLAQMSPSEAKLLADSLGENRYVQSGRTRIDVLLSAADLTEGSPNLTINLPKRESSSQPSFVPVITPAPVFEEENCLEKGVSDCIASLQINKSPDGSASLTNYPSDMPLERGAATSIMRWPTPFCSTAVTWTWECDTLRKMMDEMTADYPHFPPDVAILEEKDFDYVRGGFSPSQQPPSSQQAFQALWNAGNLTRVSLLGSTINAILQQNLAVQSQSFQVLASARKAQQLKILGIEQVGKQYYIKGIPINGNEIYYVATTDNLANSTSDYPMLASQDQNVPEIFWRKDGTIDIAGIGQAAYVNRTRGGNTRPPETLRLQDLEAPLTANLIQPSSRQSRSANTATEPQAFTYSTRTLAYPKQSPTYNVESMPLLRFVLYQAAFGYSNSDPNQLSQNIGANLGGVTNPNVVTPSSSNFSATVNWRLAYYWQRSSCSFCPGAIGSDVQLNFVRSAQGSTTPPPAVPTTTTTGQAIPSTSISFPGNTYTVSLFLQSQTKFSIWKPWVIRPPLFTGNVLAIPEYLSSSTPNVNFYFSQHKTYALGGYAGTRLDWDDFRYIEAGYVYQTTRNVLTSVTIPGMTPCFLSGKETLSKCAMTFAGSPGAILTPSYSTYHQQGGYWLLMLTSPFSVKSRIRLMNQFSSVGNFYAYGSYTQSSALTHYAIQASECLQVALPANLSVGPTESIFLFQANGHFEGSSLIRKSFGIQLNYSFDCRSGGSFGKCMVGKIQ
jgi:hypothetical protein